MPIPRLCLSVSGHRDMLLLLFVDCLQKYDRLQTPADPPCHHLPSFFGSSRASPFLALMPVSALLRWLSLGFLRILQWVIRRPGLSLISLFTAFIVAITGYIACLLTLNFDNSTHILSDHASHFSQIHRLVPLLFPHELALRTQNILFSDYWASANVTGHCIRRRDLLPDYVCPMTDNQAVQLGAALLPLERSLYSFKHHHTAAETSLRLSWSNLDWHLRVATSSLDHAAGGTANRSHTAEVLLCARDAVLGPPSLTTGEIGAGINILGLSPLYDYTMMFPEAIDKSLSNIIHILFDLLDIHDSYASLFENLTDIGLSNCTARLVKRLEYKDLWLTVYGTPEREQTWWDHIKALVKKPFSRAQEQHETIIERIQIPDAVSAVMWHYWSIATLLYDWKSGIVALYHSCAAHAPSLVLPWEPYGPSLNSTTQWQLAALEKGIRNRQIPVWPRERRIWTHPSTPEDVFQPLPDLSWLPSPAGSTSTRQKHDGLLHLSATLHPIIHQVRRFKVAYNTYDYYLSEQREANARRYQH
ncbi:MAG: hypothetical protein Q9219_005291 [cf. Caloplaca sp. 3 TL-2023]